MRMDDNEYEWQRLSAWESAEEWTASILAESVEEMAR